MTQTAFRFCFIVGFLVVPIPGVIHAQHGGDVFVGRTQQNRVAHGGFDVEDSIIALYPVSGLIRGWSDNDPGFDRVVNDMPGQNLYRLPIGARIRLEIVSIDAAFRLIDNAVQIADAPGEGTTLGDSNLHTHVTWHINSAHPLFDPAECVWQATFILRDEGNTRLQPSAPFTMRFTNLPPRTADGDWNQDGVVDLDDHAALAACLDGPERLPMIEEGGCILKCLYAFDFDQDRDVDLPDAAEFLSDFSGP